MASKVTDDVKKQKALQEAETHEQELEKQDLPEEIKKEEAVPAQEKEVLSGKLRECPQQWYDNQMPVVDPPKIPVSTQYFIIDGKRFEYDQVDVEWVKNNCKVNKPTVLY